MNEEQMENRFGKLRKKSTEELEFLVEELYEDLDSFENTFNTTRNSNEKNDACVDINFLKDEIYFIESILKERSKTR